MRLRHILHTLLGFCHSQVGSFASSSANSPQSQLHIMSKPTTPTSTAELVARESGREIVVVTGASGCLGHQLVRLLIGQDERVGEVRCLDLVEPEDSMRRSLELELDAFQQAAGWRKQLKLIRGDIRDINVVERTLEGADCVIHCAAKVDIWLDNCEQDANELESINIQATELLLKAAVRLGIAKFIHVSSFESFTGYHTVYYATENTLPDPKVLLFGQSGLTKREAERRVRQFSNNKLSRPARLTGKDSLNAIVVRFSLMYGEYDKYYVSKLLRIANFFGGTLQRFSNVWIRQQPIYVGNAAWALVKAKQRMDSDDSISGEDFNITDDTKIGDPFVFLEPYLKSRNMRLSEKSYAALPIFLLISLFFWFGRFVRSIDIFNWFTSKKTRLQAAIDEDNRRRNPREADHQEALVPQQKPTKWYHLIKPQIFFFMCNSLFLNRTKASLRLDYEPLYDCNEARERSINWYKNQLKL